MLEFKKRIYNEYLSDPSVRIEKLGYLNGRALSQIGNMSRLASPEKFFHRKGVAHNSLKSFLRKGVTMTIKEHQESALTAVILQLHRKQTWHKLFT